METVSETLTNLTPELLNNYEEPRELAETGGDFDLSVWEMNSIHYNKEQSEFSFLKFLLKLAFLDS